MNRVEKEQQVESARTQFEAAPFVVLTDFKGSTVAEMQTLRRACEPVGASYLVLKNTLCRIAVTETGLTDLSRFFRGNTGVFFSGEDPIASAKLLKEQLKENENLVVKAGFFEGELLDEAGVAGVADLMSRDELQSMLLRTIQEAPRQVLGVLQAPSRDLLYLLNNYAAGLPEEG